MFRSLSGGYLTPLWRAPAKAKKLCVAWAGGWLVLAAASSYYYCAAAATTAATTTPPNTTWWCCGGGGGGSGGHTSAALTIPGTAHPAVLLHSLLLEAVPPKKNRKSYCGARRLCVERIAEFLDVSSPPRQPTIALSTALLRVLSVSILSPKRAHTPPQYILWTISPCTKLCGAQGSSIPAPPTSAVSAIRKAISGPSGTPTSVASRHLHAHPPA